MKATKKFVIVLSCVLLAFFLIELAYYVYFDYKIDVSVMLISQLTAFSLAACSIVIFCVWSLTLKAPIVQGITRIILLSEDNAFKEEFSLIDRTSALIGKRDSVYIRPEIDASVEGYAVVNCVGGYWYVERVLDERNVGLKRAGEQFVYRMRSGISYRLQINDIIYIGDERLLLL